MPCEAEGNHKPSPDRPLAVDKADWRASASDLRISALHPVRTWEETLRLVKSLGF